VTPPTLPTTVPPAPVPPAAPTVVKDLLNGTALLSNGKLCALNPALVTSALPKCPS
jgi:hypothetical protein